MHQWMHEAELKDRSCRQPSSYTRYIRRILAWLFIELQSAILKWQGLLCLLRQNIYARIWSDWRLVCSILLLGIFTVERFRVCLPLFIMRIRTRIFRETKCCGRMEGARSRRNGQCGRAVADSKVRIGEWIWWQCWKHSWQAEQLFYDMINAPVREQNHAHHVPGHLNLRRTRQ